MAANTEQLDRRAKAIEKELYKRADGGSACAELAAVLQEYRAACEALIFSNFEYASAHELQTTLWNAHLKVNAIFRQEHKLLKRSKDHVVEIRKFQKLYLQFIKASQRFYRQYILNLDTQFDGIPELRKIAQKWKDDTSRSSSRQRIPATLKTQVLLSCHQTLIQLGDLSRYRETELVEKNKERNWGPAKGYYDLAAEIYPDSGHAPNQLAVIAREDGDHFRCVYHLYRSLASREPYPQAKANLATEFKRVIAAWDSGQLINNHKSAEGNTGRALIAWFIRLHSKLYKGEEFAAHDELEGEVLSHLAIELKERPLDSVLTKIILINMSAEYFATVQLQSANPPPNVMRTYFYYLRLNVKTFFILLQILQPELDRLFEGNDVKLQNGDRSTQLSDKITAVARRILPGLRLYSTWFTRFWKVLNANIADTLNTVDVQELWKAYAATLSLLASSFPVDQLPRENYMLEEDTDTIGFEPLIHPDTMKVWYEGDNMKQKWTDLERNHPNVEMLMRVKDLLIDGLLLTQNEEAPLDLDLAGSRFIYREEGLPSELLASPTNQTAGSPVLSVQAADMPLFQNIEAPIAEDQKSYSIAAGSESASTTIAKDNAMRDMVDDLVGGETGLDPLVEEDENIPPTPPEQTFDDTAVVNDNMFAPAALSINDLVNSVKNYKPLSPVPPSTLLATPMGRSGSTSSIRQLPNLPSVPDGQWNSNSIWNRTPGPASPSMLNSNGFVNDMRRSPMIGTKTDLSGHVRGDSANSLLSVDNITPSTIRAQRPLSGSFSGGIGSGAAWGTQSSPSTWGSPYANNFTSNQQYGYANGANMASPVLFSSYRDNADSQWGRTPPNGQGG
ncbi:EST1-DNA-bind multi-domain protein [Pyrenophora tritici-repentis]|uniref:EST1-DNA-bind multi-domain protein n=2 Tax=Pyrenophora tritici-repentis TaxID=45151 RepID=A0A2W1E846_9PLEO|nr:uncharacterized protein PTRG_10336 [Pyrenophora tritici-repentis Pt-1C-BFP]KAF7450197.1 EST1 DNA bind multi-domain protein [Pyrenophora tritici-repentis]EDU43387.1 conserved hypothetical protein [Pyrenophora tritici-repentis Pt-1C-BFP]KAG9376166.1 EST1 DNA bind multi-domain protein [Pyrenophora tritici-repentis]KAI0583208.1 EST1-DNA-bind multi-domain protein [Pyrenophora tritici-repentis]KAI0610140.1 EST1-DNA-bind multi-domain protein [Pyrenophora tritici-repentis]